LSSSPPKQVHIIDASTPVGTFRVGATDHGVALVCFPRTGAKALELRLASLGLEPGAAGRAMARRAARELVAYFEDKLDRFGVPIDLELFGDFDRDIYRCLVAVPPGETVTYGFLAEMAERPGAARAVGGAVGRNPAPIIIPCHRVVPAAGGLGGWSGPRGWKKRLLDHEGADLG